MPDEKEKRPCKVPGCSGAAMSDEDPGVDGYCSGHRADRVRFVQQAVEKFRKEQSTPWDQDKNRSR